MIATPSLNGTRFERFRARRGTRVLLLALPLLALVSIFTISDLRGVDFGTHWDEDIWQIDPVRQMVQSGVLLPRASIYPTLGKWLSFLPSIPAGIRAGFKRGSTPGAVQAAMVAAVNAADYLLTVRRLYIFVSALAIVWVYGAGLALRRPWWEALIAACGLGLSWEYAYHARFVATDCILVQFSALTLMMLALFFRGGKSGWLYAAAAAAGLGTGTKYPGVILLVPVMLSGVLTLPARNLRAQALRLVGIGATAFGVYLLTTPATLLDPFAFADQLGWISKYYKDGHVGYTVSGAWQHWRVVLTYFAIAYFSPHRLFSVALFASAVLGAVAWIRADRRLGSVLLCLPVVFLIYFCGSYRAVIVRNYLFLTPFLALFAARGVAEIFGRLPQRWARWPLTGALVLGFATSAVWLIQAGEGIRHPSRPRDVQEALAYVAKHPGTKFRLSGQVRALAASEHLILPANVTEKKPFDQVVFFARAEGPGDQLWKSNDPWNAKAIFGTREVNFNWYTTWWGPDRIVVMTVAKAKATGVALAN